VRDTALIRTNVVVALLSALAASVPSAWAQTATQPKPANPMKEIFPIGVWYDGRVEGINCPKGYVDVPAGQENARKYYETTFKDIKEHGIDIVVIPNTPPDYRQTLLTVADKVGVKIVLEVVELAEERFGGNLSIRNTNMIRDEAALLERLRTVIEPIKSHPSLMAYQLIDEPPATLFDNWQRASRALQRIDPDRPSFSCLCNEGELDRVRRMGCQMMIFDRYIIGENTKPGDYDWQAWIGLIETIRRQADAFDLPFWIVVQTCAKPGGLRYPTAAELRTMTWLALARNAKGVFFFLYNTHTQEESLQGLVDTQLKPRPIYEPTATLARDLRKLAPLLLDLHPVTRFASTQAPVDVQCFADGKRRRYLFLTSLDVVRRIKCEVTFTSLVVRQCADCLTGQSIPATSAERLTVSLDPGQGMILEINP